MKPKIWMQCVLDAANEMPKYTKELCLLDTKIGDGDHGVTIERGYRSISRELQPTDEAADFCKKYSQIVSDNMGGAIGPVYYYFWNSLSTAVKGSEVITAEVLAQGFEKAAAKIMTACSVKPGDKTVLDAIIPAAQAMAEHRHEPLAQALAAAVKAADQGREATLDMVAQKGRAKFLAEKSQGHYDAGAASFVLWLKELEKAIKAKETQAE